jgi:serine carboxypeptidase-like clade 1
MKDTGIRMLFYSGDTDGAVPLAGTRKWIKDLNWGVKDAWRPWMTNDQVAGYVIGYNGLDFATVKGVGHMAPQWARQQVTQLISNWIAGEDI